MAQVVSFDPVIRWSPGPALSNATHVTMSDHRCVCVGGWVCLVCSKNTRNGVWNNGIRGTDQWDLHFDMYVQYSCVRMVQKTCYTLSVQSAAHYHKELDVVC